MSESLCWYQVSTAFRLGSPIVLIRITSLFYAELFLTVACVFRRLDMELFETTDEDVACDREFLAAMPKASSQGVRFNITGALED